MFRKSAPSGIVPPASNDATVKLEPMHRRHLRSVNGIEQRIFPRPWSQQLYASEIAQPETRRYFVAVVDNEVVGYIGCMLVLGEGHITTVGVAPEWHRRSLGTQLLLHLIADVRARGATSLTLEVRATNAGAQELYRQFGFVPAGIRKNYYSEVGEDAIVMWAHDVDSEEYRERINRIATRLHERGDTHVTDSGTDGEHDLAHEGGQTTENNSAERD
jgi:ribosomal-protein-alanine N-acetyltransferase